MRSGSEGSTDTMGPRARLCTRPHDLHAAAKKIRGPGPSRLVEDVADGDLYVGAPYRADFDLAEEPLAVLDAEHDVEPAVGLGVTLGVKEVQCRPAPGVDG